MFKKILVPLDRSPLAEQALDIAAEIAAAANAPIDLVLAHQRMVGTTADDAFDIAQRLEDDRYLEAIANELRRDQKVSATHTVLVGDPPAMIAARAHDIDADLIVMTSHGRTGWNRALLGSVADGVMRASSIPVLMLRVAPGDAPRGNVRPILRRILVPLDGSPLAESMLAHAVQLAHSLQGRITLFRAVQPATVMVPAVGADAMAPLAIEDPELTRRALDAAAKDVERCATLLADQGCVGVECQTVVAQDAADAIVDFIKANDIDLVAMSSHGRGASRLLFGSVADKVLRSTSAAVLLNRPIDAPRDREAPPVPHFATA